MRNTDERFDRLLPLFAKRTAKVSELIPQMYLHGLSEGDFDLALRGLLGEDAPLSAATVARLKERWNGELAEWRSRRLDEHEVVYVWVDGVYVKGGKRRRYGCDRGLERFETGLSKSLSGIAELS